MHDKATAAPLEEDDVYEEAVLRHVLHWQPTILRMRDLIREVRPVPSDTEPRDAVERAVRQVSLDRGRPDRFTPP
jgi:hypothetical protein